MEFGVQKMPFFVLKCTKCYIKQNIGVYNIVCTVTVAGDWAY